MSKRSAGFVLSLLALIFASSAVDAHPHVWVTVKSELVYAPDGAVTGVRHAWTFDDMFSTYATQGLESKEPGVFTREELAPLAEVNVTSLKEYDYFTYAKASGKKQAFNDPVDYWVDLKDQMLTLYFTLPFKAPVKSTALDLEIYDPTYFVDFTFAEKDAFALTGAPAQCGFSIRKPTDAEVDAKVRSMGEALFAEDNGSNYGSMFANRIAVKCP
jgi:ABC-type uncharacterized transport system substrate-binding protein